MSFKQDIEHNLSRENQSNGILLRTVRTFKAKDLSDETSIGMLGDVRVQSAEVLLCTFSTCTANDLLDG